MIPAGSLSSRYVQAAAMCRSAQNYHNKLMEGILGADLQTWEAEITHAERMRKEDKSVMDIIGATEPQSLEANAEAPGDAEIGGAADAARGPNQWLRLAIQIEQKQ
jgi:hypothetical protein